MRAIKRSATHEDLVRRLAETPHPISNKSIFPTMRELLCFAAVLGFEHEMRRPLLGQTLEIEGRIFLNSQQAVDLVYLIALASSRDADILREEREPEMVALFEEFANGGLEILQAWMCERPDDLHGDKAILSAMVKHNFLTSEKPPEAVAASVEF
jgi:dnd system-associated protein 4